MAKNKTERFAAGTAIGLLGGGQLARMLALAAHPMGASVHVLSENSSDPAAQVTGNWQRGSPLNEQDLRTFLSKVEVATFESEFLNAELLMRIEGELACKIYPSPRLMGQLQDRLTQKNALLTHELPTAPFISVEAKTSSFSELQFFFKKHKRIVIKTRRGGYDGYGTFIIRNSKQLAEFMQTAESQKNSSHGWIAENFVPFEKEMAVIVARNIAGHIQFFPLVETYQENSRCLWVKGPCAMNYSVLQKKIKNFLDTINYVGVMGIEFFRSGKTLLINEIAPRVHNSGHYSQNALNESQFTYHIKCILGQTLPPAKCLTGGFAMVNLLGAKELKPQQKPNWARENVSSQIHWYGKSESRSGRKMGHINCTASTANSALSKALEERRKFFI